MAELQSLVASRPPCGPWAPGTRSPGSPTRRNPRLHEVPALRGRGAARAAGRDRARRLDVCRGDRRACAPTVGPCTTSARCRTSASPGPAPPAPTGPGTRNGSLSTAVVAVELVRGDGELVRFAHGDPEFPGAVLALGCLGVVTRLWLRVEPAWEVRQVVHTGVPTAALLDGIHERHRRRAQRQPVHVVPRPVDARRGLGQAARGGGRRSGTRAPRGRAVDHAAAPRARHGPGRHDEPARHGRALAPPAAPLQARVHAERRGGAAVGVLPAPRPRGGGPRGGESPWPRASSVPCRSARSAPSRADDLWLSPCHGRDTVTVHFTWHPDREAVDPVLAEVERVLEPFDPRPHWGKVFHPLERGAARGDVPGPAAVPRPRRRPGPRAPLPERDDRPAPGLIPAPREGSRHDRRPRAGRDGEGPEPGRFGAFVSGSEGGLQPP